MKFSNMIMAAAGAVDRANKSDSSHDDSDEHTACTSCCSMEEEENDFWEEQDFIEYCGLTTRVRFDENQNMVHECPWDNEEGEDAAELWYTSDDFTQMKDADADRRNQIRRMSASEAGDTETYMDVLLQVYNACCQSEEEEEDSLDDSQAITQAIAPALEEEEKQASVPDFPSKNNKTPTCLLSLEWKLRHHLTVNVERCGMEHKLLPIVMAHKRVRRIKLLATLKILYFENATLNPAELTLLMAQKCQQLTEPNVKYALALGLAHAPELVI
uniref:Uncharacterized protein n=1 Tax=Entomoneis paludosa TaxID=265537 RepID=A0A7S2YIW1_9STRA|mmetsp:Transcript_34994/g.72874  ORF Transcript_34994/g.72874 Transcript_34994/m.72874 type:complete len:272 (+) Transcript_34994:123-938(+)|eukprot:CAMPEP_0172456156 /NCGR_PEP_ID=MMETSP1065-20121228/14229_1 /TAXON_ID=265537 /ORGANISM="Amphiprora paludosa, Strain CCMP125" /LENGTH=271 /DNA_ID=CAMNT_0013208859 /DNA_START=97 /DNA_END=912 /DNA_ORIENTATION=-